jgi:hypothetical protein
MTRKRQPTQFELPPFGAEIEGRAGNSRRGAGPLDRPTYCSEQYRASEAAVASRCVISVFSIHVGVVSSAPCRTS